MKRPPFLYVRDIHLLSSAFFVIIVAEMYRGVKGMKKSAKHVQAAICMAMCFCLVSCVREEIPAGSPEPEEYIAVSTQLEASASVDPTGTQSAETSGTFAGEQTQATEVAPTTNATEKHVASTTSATTKAVSRLTQAPTKAPTQPETAPTTYPTDAQGRPILPPPELTAEEAYAIYLTSLATTYSMENVDFKTLKTVCAGPHAQMEENPSWSIDQRQARYQGQSMLSFKMNKNPESYTVGVAYDGTNAYAYEERGNQVLCDVGYPSTLEQFEEDFLTLDSDEMGLIWFNEEDVIGHKVGWITAFCNYRLSIRFQVNGNKVKKWLEKDLAGITGAETLTLDQVDRMSVSIGLDLENFCFMSRSLYFTGEGTIDGEPQYFQVDVIEYFEEPQKLPKKPYWCTDKITSREDLFGPGF